MTLIVDTHLQERTNLHKRSNLLVRTALRSLVPTNDAVPEIDGTTTVGQTLTATTGEWSGIPVSYSYQWYADDVVIGGAKGAAFVLTSAQLGAEITVAVVAINDVGRSAPAVSAAVGPVA